MIISPVKAAEAAGVLCVGLDELTPETLGRAYREKAKECHPDYHGNAKLDQWARVSWAKECLTHWLQQRPAPAPEGRVESGPVCLRCGGVGRLKVAGRRFGAPLTVMCDTCRGLGTLEAAEDDHDD